LTAIFNFTYAPPLAILLLIANWFRSGGAISWILSLEDRTMQFVPKKAVVVGSGGSLPVLKHDDVSHKLLMLLEGECGGIGPVKAAQKFGFTKQRYFQIRSAYKEYGSQALVTKARGPKRNYRRTSEVVRQVIRYRFLDPDSSPEVISQKLKQLGFVVSIRSVERVIAEYGLQKKTLQMLASPGRRRRTTR
jgi:hypothetical protein